MILIAYLSIFGNFIKKSRTMTILILVLMWILLGFNTVSPDGESYRFSYNNYLLLANHYEPLYSLLVNLAHQVKINFELFRVLYSILIVLFTYLGCKRFTEYTTNSLAIYLMTFFLWYISGMRFALAMAITIFATSFLWSKKKTSLMLFCVFLFIATQIHYSCTLFYILILARQKEIDRKRFLFIFFVASLVTIIVLNTDILYTLVICFTDRDKTTQWFVNDSSAAGRPSLIGLATSLAIVFGNIAVSYFANKFTANYHNASKEDKTRSVFIYNANCSMMLLLPLLFININFMRAYIGMSVITLFGVTTALNQAKSLFNFSVFSVVTFVWLSYYLFLHNFDIRVWEMISNNKLFIF